MKFTDFIQKNWVEHGSQPDKVARELAKKVDEELNSEQTIQISQLLVHIYGEHLARFEKGISVLNKLQNSQLESEAQIALQRSMAALELSGGKRDRLDSLSHSNQARALTISATALATFGKIQESLMNFQQALAITSVQLSTKDPANRYLAIAGNNLACSLEKRANKSDRETEFMIMAAHTGRKYWEIAGGWLEVERAEYRLAMSYLNANRLEKALVHGQNCLKIAIDNSADPIELFFAYEAIARIERARKREPEYKEALARAKDCFSELSAEDQSWCAPSLEKISKPCNGEFRPKHPDSAQ